MNIVGRKAGEHIPKTNFFTYQAIRRWDKTTLIFVMFVILFFLFLFFVMYFMLITKNLTADIGYISGSIAHMAFSEGAEKIEVRRQDEIGEIAIQVNRMSEKIDTLMRSERDVLQANKDMITCVAHDLRTPLTSIIGSSASYLDDAQNMSEQERMELISNINEDAQWLLNMVENLLSVTKIQNESSKVKKSQEIVEEVVSESIVRLQKRLPKIQIRVSMPEDFLMIPMDATLIEQVLINLMENAYVHSSSSDPIDLLITDQPDCVTFAVRDYGIGLDPDQIPFIFDGQYSSDTADGHKGIGIGLSICRTIIHAHDGVIHAANLDKGAEFSFTLPKEKENANYA